jgi:hypothetical protein
MWSSGTNGKWRTSSLGRRLHRAVGFFELLLMKLYRKPEDFKMLNKLIKTEKEFNFKPSEVFMIFSLAKTKAGSIGDFAEVGVFHGLSAEVICRAKGENELWLFDTFEGMPKVGTQDTLFEAGTYKGSLDGVKSRLSPWRGVHIIKGLFPQSATPVLDKQFAFVHLDVDIYESTRAALEFFYQRMIEGGIIISHDYGQAAGVRRAFDEFFCGKKEKVIELPMSQCAVIKDL